MISAAVAGRAICFIELSFRSRADRFGRRQVMLAKRDHGARLRAFRALGTLSDETYLIAESELVEPAIRDAVAVEIDLVAIGAQDEATILLGEKACDPTVVGHRVQLNLAAPLANMIFEQS